VNIITSQLPQLPKENFPIVSKDHIVEKMARINLSVLTPPEVVRRSESP